MNPATKEMLTAWLRGLLILAVVALLWRGCSQIAFGQSKPDTAKVKAPETVTLSMDKLGATFQDLQKELKEAEDNIEAWTKKRDGLVGQLQMLQRIATDSSFTVKKASK